MQSQRSKTIMVGALVIGGMAITGYLIILFGDVRNLFGGGTYPLNIYFADGVANTREGTDVMLGGKRIGGVSRIDFVSGDNLAEGVQVVCNIEKRYIVPRSARAYEIMSAPVMGRAVIQVFVRRGVAEEIVPPDAQIPGEVRGIVETLLPPTMAPALETSIRQIGELAESLRPVAKGLDSLLENRPTEEVDRDSAVMVANLSTAVQRMDQVLRNMNNLVGAPDQQAQLRETIANMKASSEKLKAALDEIHLLANDVRGTSGEFRAAIVDIRGFMSRLDEMMQGLSGAGVDTLQTFGSTAVAMEQVVNRINEGKGTAGLLVNDNRLYEAMLEMMQRMDAAIGKFQETLEMWQRGELRFKIM